MFTIIHTLLLLLGLERTLRSHESQPRVWGGILITTAALGSALEYYQLSTFQWVVTAILYTICFLAGVALSPVQILLVFWQKPRNEVRTGIDVLYEPEDAEDISVDIIAVHGLGSDPDWAWTYWEVAGGVEVSNNVMWLRDLLPHALPSARIMVFNHDSAWRFDAPVKSVQDCGNQLLDAVRTCRKSDEENKRRIIFIGHSFGGIVIKKALVTAGQKSAEARYQSLSESFLGALFLGVPHDGSPLTKAGVVVSYITYWLGSRTELLEALKPGTEALWVLNDAFLKGYGTSEHHIVNFCETRKTQKWGIPFLLAVDHKASSMAGKANVMLECDHMRMNKFKSEVDGNYQLVLRELIEMVERVQKDRAGVVTEELEKCLSTIYFKELDAHFNNVPEADESTFDWIWADTRILDWRVASPGILWIVGKPGSGKSTLCKYLFGGLSEEAEDLSGTIVAEFFFNARGASFAQSFRGLLQALLYQTVRKVPVTSKYILPEYRAIKDRLDGGGEWPLKLLLDILLDIIADPAIKSMHLLIDALDECSAFDSTAQTSEEDALTREYLSTIFSVALSNSRFKILVTSRHRRFPGILDVGYEQLTLETMTRSDIRNFLERRIVAIPAEHREFVQADLMRRASGVFLWVKLVLDELIDECAEISDEELKQILISIPNKLDSLYARMLNKLVATLKAPQLAETKLMFEWVSLAERPLTVAEFRYAIALSQHKFASTDSFEKSGKVQRLDQTPERLKSRSAGLLEVRADTVQFIHQSAKEFCQNPAEFTSPFGFSVLDAHIRIAVVCTEYLSWAEFSSISIPDLQLENHLGPTYRRGATEPFLLYAVRWFVHAQLADASGNPLLKDIVWVFASSRSSVSPAWPLSFAAQNNMLRFLTYLLDQGMDVNLGDYHGSHIGSPLQHAAQKGHIEIAKALISRGADVNLNHPKFGNALMGAIRAGQRNMAMLLLENGADPNLRATMGGTAVNEAIVTRDESFVKLILDRGGNVNDETGSPLRHAVTSLFNAEKLVQILLDRGADVNKQGGSHGDALREVICWNGNEKVVRMLLDNGAHIDAQDGDRYESALLCAAEKGNIKVVKLLLDRGARINAQSGCYGTALHAAASEKGRKELLALLLDRGADINALGGHYGTALQAAAAYPGPEGNVEVVRFLLERGAVINTAGGIFGNALQAAALNRGNEKVVKLLLDNGADINSSGGKYGSAVQAAARGGSDQIIEMLLDNGADVNAPGGKYGSALQAAARGKNEKAIQILLDRGADVNVRGGKFETALMAAAYQEDEELVIKLLEGGSDVNIPGDICGNALHIASTTGMEKAVELILEKGANVNAQGGQFGNALNAAAYGGYEAIVELLLNVGADVNAPGIEYESALLAAAYEGFEGIVMLLLEHGADINIKSEIRGSVLSAAAYSGLEEAVEALLSKGADVNACPGPPGAAIHSAAQEGRGRVIQLLLDNGADINLKSGSLHTALQAAASTNNGDKVLKLLLDQGAEVNAQGGYYGTALQAASVKPRGWKAVELLLSRGADVNAQGGKYGNALQAAAWKGEQKTVEVLLAAGADPGMEVRVEDSSESFDNAIEAAEKKGRIQLAEMIFNAWVRKVAEAGDGRVGVKLP